MRKTILGWLTYNLLFPGEKSSDILFMSIVVFKMTGLFKEHEYFLITGNFSPFLASWREMHSTAGSQPCSQLRRQTRE